MNSLAYSNLALRKVFIDSNGILGAFVWREGPRDYQVLEGKPDELTGFVAFENIKTLREANEKCDALNKAIEEAVKYAGGDVRRDPREAC